MAETKKWHVIDVTAFDRGNVNVELFQSDGSTAENGTGNTYTMNVFLNYGAPLKFSTTLVGDTPASGLYHWAIASSQIDDTIESVVAYQFKIFKNLGAVQVGFHEGTLNIHPRGPVPA